MHIVVTAIGSAGDINPMMMIACELQQRGHDVEFIANGYFENKVVAAGLKFLPLGGVEFYKKALDDPDMWDPLKAFQAVWRTLNEGNKINIELIESSLKEETVLVGSSLAFGSRIVQEKHHKKGSTVHLAPSCIISGCEPMAMPLLPFVPRLPLTMRKLLMNSIDTLFLDTVCRDDLNVLRGEHGLPPVKHVLKNWMHSPDQVICGFPSWYAWPQADWPPNTVLTGFPVYDRPEDRTLPPELEKFLQDGEAPVVFTAGSAMAHSKKNFETAVSAAKQAGKRAVLVSAFPEQIPQNLPSDILHVLYAPFSVLFPRASVVQHHGGIGTSAQCLAAGIPQLVAPFAHDQFDNAYRLSRLGVAREPKRLHPDHWAKALIELTNSKAVKSNCQALRKSIEESPSATGIAADAIESLK